MAGRFSETLVAAAGPLLEQQLAHPFVRGIATGTIEPERFRHFVRQDYRFLLDYARALSLAAARAPDAATAARLAALAHETATEELALHRSYAAAWGIAAEELEAESPSPTTRAYGDFLLETAAHGEFGEAASALLACMWGYSELGRRLAAAGPPADERCARWIETYADDAFAQLARWCAGVVDEAAAEAGERQRRQMQEAFLVAVRFELTFWQASWELESPSTPGESLSRG